MGNYVGAVDQDPQVSRMRKARDRAVVLKTRLMSYRSQHDSVFVLVFEGPDDPVVYSQWIRRVTDCFEYEYLVAKGKGPLLEFMSMMDRDANNANEKVLYFIDHDYDGSRGYSSNKLFMTDTYSVENYLVDPEVVDEILKVAFHCTLAPETRASIKALFEEVYGRFIANNTPINKRIHAARKLKIELKNALPDKINNIATVSVQSVGKVSSSPEELIQLAREPTASEWDQLNTEFDQLEPTKAHRGKFSVMFLNKWFEMLAQEYKLKEIGLFSQIEGTLRVRHDEFSLSNYASKSSIPSGLAHFVNAARQ